MTADNTLSDGFETQAVYRGPKWSGFLLGRLGCAAYHRNFQYCVLRYRLVNTSCRLRQKRQKAAQLFFMLKTQPPAGIQAVEKLLQCNPKPS